MRQDELPIFPSIESITFAVSLDTNFLLNVTSTSLHSRALLRSMSFKWGNFMMIYKNPMMSLKYTFLEHEKYHLHNHITTSSRAIELSFCQAKMFLMIYVNLDNKARKNCELLFIATPHDPAGILLVSNNFNTSHRKHKLFSCSTFKLTHFLTKVMRN